jgi:MYXO-CTERM domain-containing protein
MDAATGYIMAVAFVLALAALAAWRRRGASRMPLIVYVIGVTVVWIIVLAFAWGLAGPARFRTFLDIAMGFALGMLAMYIAIHVYK